MRTDYYRFQAAFSILDRYTRKSDVTEGQELRAYRLVESNVRTHRTVSSVLYSGSISSTSTSLLISRQSSRRLPGDNCSASEQPLTRRSVDGKGSALPLPQVTVDLLARLNR